MFALTYFGHAAVLVQFEKFLLIDPGIIEGQVLVNPETVHPAYILVSNVDLKHFGNVAILAEAKGSLILGNKQVIDEIRSRGTPSYQLESLKDKETFETRFNIAITAYGLRRGGLMAPRNYAFLIKSPQGSVLHLGHAKEFAPLQEVRPDLLCVPVAGKKQGAFSSLEAAEATAAIAPRYVLPISGTKLQVEEYFSQLVQQEIPVKPLTPSIGDVKTLV